MQEGFAAKNKVSDRGTSINLGGDGRYVYFAGLVGAAWRVFCYDATLLTAANYAGAGTWTVNPLIATINLANTNRSLIYIPSRLEVWAISDSVVERINANPTAGGFNTLIGSFTHGVNQPAFSACYVSAEDTVIIMANNSQRIVSCKLLSVVSNSLPWLFTTIGVAERYTVHCNHGESIVLTGGNAGANITVSKYTLQPVYSAVFTAIGSGVAATSIHENLLTIRTTSVVTIFRLINSVYTRLASLSVATATNNSRYAYCKNRQVIYMPNGNNLRKILLSPTIADGGSIAHGTTQSSGVFQANNESLIIIASANQGATAIVNLVDPSNDTYIGYLTLPGTYDSSNSLNTQYSYCKNQLEI